VVHVLSFLFKQLHSYLQAEVPGFAANKYTESVIYMIVKFVFAVEWERREGRKSPAAARAKTVSTLHASTTMPILQISYTSTRSTSYQRGGASPDSLLFFSTFPKDSIPAKYPDGPISSKYVL